ncbi:hypothetical protein BH24ACT19_BH24ACT19_01420 [soil metagenome]|jgi:hypothetical protein
MRSPDNGGRLQERKIGDILRSERMATQEHRDHAEEVSRTVIQGPGSGG